MCVYRRFCLLYHLQVHISLHFISFVVRVIYVRRDLQNDLGTKDIDAYLTDSEMVVLVERRNSGGEGVV